MAGGIRADIASDSDPDITQANYPDVVKDLTPSPNAVNTRTVKLMKNQPPRTRFWAKDLTIDHETFHADEDVKFGQEGTALAQQWLNTRTANTYEQVWAHLPNAIQMVATHVDIAMSYPGRETRAYNDGAPAYTARAQAIKTKGERRATSPAARSSDAGLAAGQPAGGLESHPRSGAEGVGSEVAAVVRSPSHESDDAPRADGLSALDLVLGFRRAPKVPPAPSRPRSRRSAAARRRLAIRRAGLLRVARPRAIRPAISDRRRAPLRPLRRSAAPRPGARRRGRPCSFPRSTRCFRG